MCEYCEDLKEIFSTDGELANISNNDLNVYRGGVTEDGQFTVIIDEFKINYCPMCGRKLKDD